MSSDIEPTRTRTPILHKAAAGLVLIVAAGLAIWFLIGIVKTIFFVVVGIAVVVAVLWALKTIVW